MNSSKNKILIGAVIILMILNIALLAAIWLTNSKQKQRRETPADFLIKELGLNNEQQRAFRSLAAKHRQQADKLREQVKEARRDLFNLLEHPAVDDSSKKAAAATAAKNLEQLDLLTFDHFKEVRALCTPAQQLKFDEIIEEVLRMMAAGPPRGDTNNHMRPPPPGH